MRKHLRALPTLLVANLLILSSTPGANPPEWQRYVVSKPQIVYPRVLYRTGMQGQGLFLLSIDPKDGTVSEVKVLKSTGYQELNELYVKNFFEWRFKPGTITSAQIPRRFHITGKRYILH
jgi:TonB family protein